MEFERKLDLKLILSILAAALMTFTGIVVETSMNVTFPTLMEEFDVGTGLVQWSTTGYLLVLSLIIPSSPFLIHRFKMKHLFLFANLVFIAGTILCMIAPYFSILLLGRVVQGIGTGIALPLMYNIILEQAPYEKMGFIVGIAAMIPGVAPAIGPFFGGIITLLWGWRMIFAFLLPLLIISFLFGAFNIRQSAKLESFPIDKTGYLFIGGFFVCLIFAINQSGILGLTHPLVVGLYVAAAIFLMVFLRHVRHVKTPLIHLRIFHFPRYTFSLLAFILFMLIALGIGFILPNFGQIVIGMNTLQAGSLLLPGCGLAACLNPAAGKIYDKNGASRLLRVTGILVILAMLLFIITLNQASFILMTAIYVVFGIGMGTLMGVLITNGLNILPDNLYADGNAVYNTLQQLFAAIGTVVASSIVAAAQANAPNDLRAGTMAGSRTVFLLFLILSVVLYFFVLKATSYDKKVHN